MALSFAKPVLLAVRAFSFRLVGVTREKTLSRFSFSHITHNILRRTPRIKLIFLVLIFTVLARSYFSYGIETDTIPSSINTPQKLAAWFEEDFSYTLTLFGRIRSFDQFMETRSGQCVDFSVLAFKALDQMGKPGTIVGISFRGIGIGHAICAWKTQQGTYSFFCNKNLHHTDHTCLRSLVNEYYPDWETIVFADRSNSHSSELVVRNFHRPSRVIKR